MIDRLPSHKLKVTLIAAGVFLSVTAGMSGRVWLSIAGLMLAAFGTGQLVEYWGTQPTR